MSLLTRLAGRTAVRPCSAGKLRRGRWKGVASVVSMVGTVSAKCPVALTGGNAATVDERHRSPGLESDARMRELHDTYAHALRWWLLSVTFGEPHGVDDIVQETLLRA